MYPVLFPIKRGDFALMTPSIFSIAERFWKHVRKLDGCWEWTGQIQSKGYGWMEFNLKRDESGKWPSSASGFQKRFVRRKLRLANTKWEKCAMILM